MTSILIGAPVDAAQFPASVTTHDETTQTNISSTTGVNGTPTVSVQFTTPTSGRVLVIISGGFLDNGGTNRQYLFPEVYEGANSSGTLKIGFTERLTHQVGGMAGGTAYAHFSRRSLVTGLTPETGHFCRLRQYVSGGSTADIRFRELTVVPVP